MSNIKIFICAHKEVPLPQHPYFLPIQAGAALHDHIVGYQPDDEGDNISTKNPHFCELTCHYWAWKNLKNVDIVGLNHYRRYFNFQKKWPRFSADKHFISTDEFLKRPYVFPSLEDILQRYDIILPFARHWRVSNTQQYADYHITKDWETLRQIIKEHSPCVLCSESSAVSIDKPKEDKPDNEQYHYREYHRFQDEHRSVSSDEERVKILKAFLITFYGALSL